eukprot:1157349-Pelagomonas_calceolata.AAC.13
MSELSLATTMAAYPSMPEPALTYTTATYSSIPDVAFSQTTAACLCLSNHFFIPQPHARV